MIKIFEILNINQKKSVFLLILYFILGMAIETLSLGMIFIILNIIINDSYLSIIKQLNLSNFFDSFDKKEIIYFVFVSYFLIFVLRTLVLIFVNYKKTKFISDIRKFFSDKLFATYLNRSIEYHSRINSSVSVRNLNDINKFADLIFELTGTVGEIIIFLGIVVLLFFFNSNIILAIILFGVFGLFLFSHYSKKINFWGFQRQFNESDKQKIIQESFRLIKLIKLLNKDNWFTKKFSKSNMIAAESDFKFLFLNSISKPIFELLALLIMIVIIILLTINDGDENNLIPALGLYAASFYRLIPSLTKIISGFINYKYNYPVLDMIHKQHIEKNSKTETNKIIFNQKIKIKNSIELRNLEFCYPGEREKIFFELNLSLKKGQIIGIIGDSGAGKTTLISLIMGFYTPTKGKILVDGKNIFEKKNRALLNIGYVPQETYLQDDTIKNNIAFATDASETDEISFLESIKNSNLEDFINKLPLGVNSKVGELGDKVSGGQKQRISIARALYSNPDILILDESTSSLDEGNELTILSEIKKYKENKIIIIISHKKTTIEICDSVYEIVNGNLRSIK